MNQASNEERDFLLWRYLHQYVNEQELSILQQQLADNQEWQDAFDAIQLEEQRFSLLETETPSLRFTKNVMESIEQKSIVQPANSYVNTRMIKWIGGSFIATIIILLVYAFSQVQWTGNTDKNTAPSLKLPTVSVNWNFISNHSLLYGCFAIVIVCLFVLADKFLMSKRHYKTEQ
ncbi:hypothetical protein [Pseudocnuella soli]